MNTMYWKIFSQILSSSSLLVFEMMVDAAVIFMVDVGNVVVSLFSVDIILVLLVLLSIAIGIAAWNWSNNWAKNTGMIDFKSANANTKRPSTTQLLQNILSNAYFNCGLQFFLLARISSCSHSLVRKIKQKKSIIKMTTTAMMKNNLILKRI